MLLTNTTLIGVLKSVFFTNVITFIDAVVMWANS